MYDMLMGIRADFMLRTAINNTWNMNVAFVIFAIWVYQLYVKEQYIYSFSMIVTPSHINTTDPKSHDNKEFVKCVK